MLRIPAILLFSLVVLFSAGCATVPVATAEARPVPQARILSDAFAKEDANTNEVVVKRDRGVNASACSSRVLVDGIAVADLYAGEKIALQLPLGDHIISARTSGLCGGDLSEISVSVRKGNAIALRIGFGTNGELKIQHTAF